MSEQLDLISPEPQAGELWNCWGAIVMVLAVGAKSVIGYMPNYVSWVALGMCEPFVPGRWWSLDYRLVTIDTTHSNGIFSELPHGCDRCYLSPWNGCGVFFGTPDGERAAVLLEEYNAASNRKMDWHLDDKLRGKIKKVCSKRVAPKGFR